MALELPTLVQRFVIDASQAKVAEGTIAGSLGRSQRLFATVGKNLTKFLTIPLLGIGLAAAHSAEIVEKAMGILRSRTGLTGQALQQLQHDFVAVAQVSSAPLAKIAEVMATLRVRTGQTGPALQALSAQVLELQRITGDAAPDIVTLTKVFGQWQIGTSQQAATLDKLFRAAQQSQVPLGDLVAQVIAFSPALKVAGFDLNHTIGLVAALGKAGINTQQAIFGIRTFLTNAAKAGKDPAQAFAAIVAQIEALAKAGRKTDAVSLGLKNFGARGVALAQAVAEGRLNVEALTQAIASGTDTIAAAGAETDKFGKFLGVIKNKATLALGDLGTKLLPTIQTGMTIVTGAVVLFAHALAAIPAAGTVFGIAVAIGPMIFLFSKLLGVFRLVSDGIAALSLRFTALRIFIAGGNLSLGTMAASFGNLLITMGPLLIALGVLVGLLAIMHQRTDTAAVALGKFKETIDPLSAAQKRVKSATDAVAAAQKKVNTLLVPNNVRAYTTAIHQLRDAQANLAGANTDFFKVQRDQVIALNDAITAVLRPNLRGQLEGLFGGAFGRETPTDRLRAGLKGLIDTAKAAGIPLDQLKTEVLAVQAASKGSHNSVEAVTKIFDELVHSSNDVSTAQKLLQHVLGGTAIIAATDGKAFLAQRDILQSLITKTGDYVGATGPVKDTLKETIRQLAAGALAMGDYTDATGKNFTPTTTFLSLLQGLKGAFPGLKTQIDGYITATQNGTPVTNALGGAVGSLGGKLTTAAEDAKALADNIKAAEDAISGALEPSLAFLDAQVALHNSTTALGEALKGAAKGAIDARGGFNIGVKGGADLQTAFTGAVRSVTDYVNKAVELGKIKPSQAQALEISRLRDLEVAYPKLTGAIEAYIAKLPQAAHLHHLAVIAAQQHATMLRTVLGPAIADLPKSKRIEVTSALDGLLNGTHTDFAKVKAALDDIKNLSPSIRKDILAKLKTEIDAHARVRVSVTVPDVGFHVLPGGGGAVLKAERIAVHVLHEGGFVDPRFGEEQLALLKAKERVLSPKQNVALEKSLAARERQSLVGLSVAGTLRIRSDGTAELRGIIQDEIEQEKLHAAQLQRMRVK